MGAEHKSAADDTACSSATSLGWVNMVPLSPCWYSESFTWSPIVLLDTLFTLCGSYLTVMTRFCPVYAREPDGLCVSTLLSYVCTLALISQRVLLNTFLTICDTCWTVMTKFCPVYARKPEGLCVSEARYYHTYVLWHRSVREFYLIPSSL